MAYTYYLIKQRNKGNATTHPQPHPIPKLLHAHSFPCIKFSPFVNLHAFVLQTCLLVIIEDKQ